MSPLSFFYDKNCFCNLLRMTFASKIVFRCRSMYFVPEWGPDTMRNTKFCFFKTIIVKNARKFSGQYGYENSAEANVAEGRLFLSVVRDTGARFLVNTFSQVLFRMLSVTRDKSQLFRTNRHIAQPQSDFSSFARKFSLAQGYVKLAWKLIVGSEYRARSNRIHS